MKNVLAYLLLSISVASCNNQSIQEVETNYSSNVTSVESDDSSMNAAIAKAKASFRDFDTAFENGHFDTSEFFVKVRFEFDGGGEHIWTNSIKLEDGSYYGIVDEDAEATEEVKQGDRVKITMDNLSDWMYNDHGVLRGGYTIKVLRNKMTPDEKASFDSSFYLKIID